MTNPFDLFAANAPEVPDWFEYVSQPRDYPHAPYGPKAANFFAEDEIVTDSSSGYGQRNVNARTWATAWLEDGSWDLPDEPKWQAWQEACQAYYTGRHAWELADRMARIVQWRFAYANAMFQERRKHIPNDNSPLVERLAGYAMTGLLTKGSLASGEIPGAACRMAAATADELGKYNMG